MSKWARKWNDSLAKAREGMVSAAHKGANFYLQRVNGKAPEGFKLADKGQCEDCDRAWHTIDAVDHLIPFKGFNKMMVQQVTLNQINTPLGLANLYKDHCDGCKLNHEKGLLNQPKVD
jgi:hypothetical protein